MKTEEIMSSPVVQKTTLKCLTLKEIKRTFSTAI